MICHPNPIDTIWKTSRKVIPELKYQLSYYNIIATNNDISYLYNTYTNALARLDNKETYLYKKYESQKEISASDSRFFRELVEAGFAVTINTDEISNMLNEINTASYLSERWRQFTILPTQKCNARCFYCFENDVNRIKMDKSILEQLPIFILDNLSGVETFNLDWFGGEPLLEYQLICDIISEIAGHTTIPFTSSITTNATLFDEERINTAINIWHLNRASITIDGLHEEHNHRKGVLGLSDAFSQTISNIRYLISQGVLVNLRVHIDKKNFHELDNILQYLMEFRGNRLFHLYVDKLFMPLQVRKHSDTDRYFQETDEKIFYEQMMISMVKYGFVDSYADFLACRRETSCIATRKDALLINCDGRLYNCVQEFYDTRNSIGSIFSGIEYNRHYNKLLNRSFIGSECETCLYLPDCVGGCWFTKSKCSSGEHRHCMRNRFLTPIALNLLLNESTV